MPIFYFTLCVEMPAGVSDRSKSVSVEAPTWEAAEVSLRENIAGYLPNGAPVGTRYRLDRVPEG